VTDAQPTLASKSIASRATTSTAPSLRCDELLLQLDSVINETRSPQI